MKPIKPTILTALVACAFIISHVASAQRDTTLNLKEKVARVNLFGLFGFNYEQGIGKGWTIRPEAGFGVPVFTESEEVDGTRKVHFESAVNPYFMVEGRYYYNLKRRHERGRSTIHFSADYIAPFYRYNAYQYLGAYDAGSETKNDVLLRDVQYMGVWWGMQRGFAKNKLCYFNWSIGPSIKTNFVDYARFTIFGQLGLGLQW